MEKLYDHFLHLKEAYLFTNCETPRNPTTYQIP